MNKLPYRFKFYYKNGTTELGGGAAESPISLYNDFDGLMDWDEFYNLSSKNLTTKEILEMAMKLYKGYIDDYYRIDIVNTESGEIVDSVSS